jgi:hypothetical protein
VRVIRTGRTAAFALLVVTLLPAGITRADAAVPGSLPQTSAEPTFGAPLTTRMKQLWHAIESDSRALGSTVFFPRGAYISMKTGAIANPASDYSGRLVAFFDLDLAAYRSRINAGGPATFVRVLANWGDAQWIAAGACENKIGYWHEPGIRLVYKHGRSTESVAVASLISWRGVWYVVHLGPNPRPSNVGTVDGFEHGPGVPGPAGGC